MNLKLKRIAISVLGILLALSISVSLAFYNNAGRRSVSADTIEKDGVAENSYVINQKGTFPTSIQTEKGVADDGVIIYPNGSTYTINEGQSFVLDIVGEYTLKYFGDGFTAYDTFKVSDKLYSLSDSAAGNSITEFTLTDSNKKLVHTNIDSDITVARGSYGGKGSSNYADGLIVKMKQGTKFSYAEPIDLTDVSEDGISNVMSFSLLNTEYYEADGSRKETTQKVMQNTYITLTDCYNPNVYIKVLIYNSDTNYARVSTNEMESKAIWVASSWDRTNASCVEVYYGSERSVVFTNSYGTSAGTTALSKGYASKLHLRYDNERGIMYWGAEQNADIEGGTKSQADMDNIAFNLIMDLKDPAVTGGTVFPGFTTGEVYLSVQFADALVNQSGRMDIYSIGNKNASAIINAAKNPYTDEKDPIINIDSNPTVNDGVYAKVGEQFAIPSATATDINLKGNVSVNVYRGYNTNKVSTVKVVDGKFKIDTQDVYYIVYSASDFYGNYSEKVFKVYGVNSDIISFDASQKIANETAVMTQTLFPLGTKISTMNNYNDLKLKIEFISSKESFVFADLKNGKEIDEFWANDNYFTTNYKGTYTVRYTYSDNAVAYVSEYQFTTKESDVKTFSEKPFIPRILLKDATYKFDTVDAIKYTSGSPEYAGKATLQISFDGGAFTNITKNADGFFAVKVTGSKTAQLKAIYDGYSILSDVAVITDVNFASALNNGGRGLNGANYFYYEDDAFTLPDDRDLRYISNNGANTNTLKFANIINLASLNFTYQIKPEFSNYEKVNFIFTDPYNPENKLHLALYKSAGSTYFSYNGVAVKLTEDFATDYDKSIEYSAKSGVLSFSGSTASHIPEISFTTQLAYFDIVLEGIRGTSGIIVKKINGQSLTKTVRDSREPDLVSAFKIGHYGVGDVLTLPAVMFVDVLSPIDYSSVATSFKFNRTNVQTALDGTKLDGDKNDPFKDYQVRIEEIGEYRYYFEVKDAFGNENSSYMIFNAVDKVAPEITFNGKIKEDVVVKVKVNDKITLDYTVSDNITATADLKTTVVLMDYTNAILYPIDAKSIKFENVGTFQVTIIVQDQENNVTIKSFDVVVSPKGGK